MDGTDFGSGFLTWVSAHSVKLIITLAVVIVYVALDRFSSPRISEEANHSGLKIGTATKAVRVARLITAVFGLMILVVVWGSELAPLLVFSTTVITLLGVALFASWSLLSNVTAYFILLLHPSFRRGVFVRILDADNYVEGYISEINVFNTKLITESRGVVVYPNNLLLLRPALINPRDRLDGVGKLPDPPERQAASPLRRSLRERRRR